MSSLALYIKYWQAASIAATVVGPSIQCPHNGRLGCTYTTTGTGTGTLSLECSMDGGSTFGTVPGASTEFTTQPAGAAITTPVVCNWSNMPGQLYRFRYTFTSGTGTITLSVAQGDTVGA